MIAQNSGEIYASYFLILIAKITESVTYSGEAVKKNHLIKTKTKIGIYQKKGK